MEEKPATAQEVLEELAACINAFDRILDKDLTFLSVAEEWSNIPYVSDHVQFLRDQAAGLSAAIRLVPQIPGSNDSLPREQLVESGTSSV